MALKKTKFEENEEAIFDGAVIEQSFGDEKVTLISNHLKTYKVANSSGINFSLLDINNF